MKGSACGEALPTNGIWGSVLRVGGSPAPWGLASLPPDRRWPQRNRHSCSLPNPPESLGTRGRVGWVGVSSLEEVPSFCVTSRAQGQWGP